MLNKEKKFIEKFVISFKEILIMNFYLIILENFLLILQDKKKYINKINLIYKKKNMYFYLFYREMIKQQNFC